MNQRQAIKARRRAGGEIARECWDLLRANPEWLKIPLFSAVGVAIISVIFGIIALVVFGALIAASPSAVADTANTYGSSSDSSSILYSIAGIVLLFLYYFSVYGIVIFSETALVGVVLMKMRGEKEHPVAADGFALAQTRLGAILGFAALSATVGMIARAVSDSGRRSRNLILMIIAMIVAAIIQGSWTIATLMVTPVIAAENLGTFPAIKRSWQLFKQTWGDQLIGRFTLGMFGCLMFLGALVPGALVGGLGLLVNSVPVIGIGVVVIFIGFAIVSLLTNAASGIFKAVLYQYATAGNTGNILDEAKVKEAFSPATAKA